MFDFPKPAPYEVAWTFVAGIVALAAVWWVIPMPRTQSQRPILRRAGIVLLKTVLSLPVLYLLATTALWGILPDRMVALDPNGYFHGCRYVLGQPELTDTCATDAVTSPLYYEHKIDKYLWAAGISQTQVRQLQYASVIDDDLNGSVLAIGKFRLDATGRKKLLAGMTRVQGPFDKALASIKSNDPPLRDWLGYSPYKSLGWWPPPLSSYARVLAYQRAVPAKIDVEGSNYYVFVDTKTGDVYLLGW